LQSLQFVEISVSGGPHSGGGVAQREVEIAVIEGHLLPHRSVGEGTVRGARSIPLPALGSIETINQGLNSGREGIKILEPHAGRVAGAFRQILDAGETALWRRGVRETLLKKNGFRAFHVRYPHLYPHALLLRELGDAV